MKNLFLFLFLCVWSFTAKAQMTLKSSNAATQSLVVGDKFIHSANTTTVASNPIGFTTPIYGAGTRLMWLPSKSAFRVGTVTGKNWDADSIGTWSFASGYNTKAKGPISTAMGNNTTASGDVSTAMGFVTTASGDYSTTMGNYTTASGYTSTAMGFYSTASGDFSTAMGRSTTASGNYSTAMGREIQASGDYSTAMGLFTTAQAYNSLVIGRYNLISGTVGSWVATEPLFVIGNGNFSTPSNALTVLKNGNVGIGTPTPDALLHIVGAGTSTPSLARSYFFQGSGSAITSNTSTSGGIVVHAAGWYWADGGGFVATSDARIKNIIGLSNSQHDLTNLRKIEVTDYKYIDEVGNGSNLQKKVIAQQLKTIYPSAVNQSKGVIPNVYQTAKQTTIIGNTTQIVTTKAHDFVTGDLVKLITESEGEKNLAVNVIDSHTFSVAEQLHSKIFVYGKKINDLLNVDYDAIAMLNVSATQELAKQVDELKAELKNYALKFDSKLSEVEELKAQMSLLKAMVLKSETVQMADKK